MPSATVAESNASMPARKAMTKALEKDSRRSGSEKCGARGSGSPVGIAWKRSPTVSTGKRRSATAAVAAKRAIR